MFTTTSSCQALDTSLKLSSNSCSKSASYSALPEQSRCGSELSAPLYSVTSKSSSPFNCTGNKESTNALKTSCGGGISFDLKNQIDAHVAKYNTTTNAAGYGGSTSTTGSVSTAGYGGSVSTGTTGTTTKSCHFNQGIGNGAEGGDPGKSAPHGGSNDELGRTPGQSFSPLPTIQALGKSFSDKCCDVKNVVTTLFNPAPKPTTTVSAAGYGGSITAVTTPISTVSAAGYGGSVSTGTTGTTTKSCHFNQGIGNGAEGGDPGKSAPHGGSNDELGRTPGQKLVPTPVACGKR